MKNEIDLERVGRHLFPYYLTILFIAPIPFGSNRTWAWATLAILSCLLLVIYLWNYAQKKIRPPNLTRDIKFVFALLVGSLIYQILQLLPLPVETIKLISPNTFELKRSGYGITDALYMTLSFDLSASLHSIYQSVLYLSLFILTICLVQSRDRLRILILTIVCIGVLQAVWGFSLFFLEAHAVEVGEDIKTLNVVKGTFVNRNHFGGFINFSVAAVIALLLASGVKERRNIHRDNFSHHWQSRVLDWRVYLVPYLGLLLIAIVFSESRGALISAFVMLVVLFSCSFFMKSGFDEVLKGHKWMIIVIGFIIVVSAADMLSERFALIDEDMNIRMAHWQNSIQLIADFKWFGVGSGNFQHLYPLYDTGVDKHRLLHAHNDYLELLVEQGLVGFVLFAMVVLICLRNAIKAVSRAISIQQNAYAIASLIAISGFLTHSLMDFNFQIPSNAVYFFIFLAVALLQGMESIHSEKRNIAWDNSAFDVKLDEVSSS